jgi:hypothetical protein
VNLADNRTMRPFNLYWVETPSAEENCFVAARSKRAAEKFEEDGTGFDTNDCKATPIRQLDDQWVSRYREMTTAGELVIPFYVQPEDVHELGIAWQIVEGDDVFVYGDQAFLKQGALNYFASLVKRREIVVIRSVADLLEAIRKAPDQSEWIFRGHSSAFWSLKASVHRLSADTAFPVEELVERERRLLDEFKRRARTFLPMPPSSDWEWLVLAQHFGLPTRLLDWTENPLVALFFAVRDRNEIANDGMIYAYHHGAKAIDLSSTSDPFTLDQIELVRPPHLDQRVIVQQSVFTAEPPLYDRGGREESDIRYWYVSVRHKTTIRNDLAKLGISESSLFPGLASLALQIKEELILSSAKMARSGKKRARSPGMDREPIVDTEPTKQS